MRLARQGLDYTPEYRKIERAARAQGNNQVYFNSEGVPQFKRQKAGLNKRNTALVSEVIDKKIYNVKAVKERNKTVEERIKSTFEERHKGYDVKNISMRDIFDAVDQFDVYTYDNVVDAIKYYEDSGMDNEDIQANIEKNINNFVNKYGEDVAQHILRNTDALTKVMTGQDLDLNDLDIDKAESYQKWEEAKDTPW